MSEQVENRPVDLNHVDMPARIAVYDDLLSSPRVIDVQPNNARDYIGELASKIYDSAKSLGGRIPYSVILQVAENFIHSHFTEVVVSVLDDGNTIRFSDQGPGIPDKQKAMTPGFSSATAQMKEVINGVGSGLPIVYEYIKSQSGQVIIEDNISHGAVVTITLNGIQEAGEQPISRPVSTAATTADESPRPASLTSHSKIILSQITPRQKSILRMFMYEDLISVTEISTELNIASSSAHYDLKKLEDLGLVTKLGKKRRLTEFGADIIQSLT